MPTLPFHNIVTLKGIHFDDFEVTMNLATTITKSDEGKAVSFDTGAANRAKLAADNDILLGRLELVEVRSSTQVIGTVALMFLNTLPVKSGSTVNIGDTVVGAGSGEVKAGTANPSDNIVVEKISATQVVVFKR